VARAGRERLRVLRTPTRRAPVETKDTTKPHPIELWLEGKLPGYRFGLVLLLLLATFVFMACGVTAPWARAVTVGLQGLTLLAALRASQVHRRLIRAAALVALVAFLSAIASLAFDATSASTGAFFLLSMLMVAAAPVVIARALWQRPVVDMHTVLGAICIYVLVGMLFSFLFAAIGYFGDQPFFVQTSDATTADYLYFAFITMTTVGYGDYTAAGGLGRSMASIEALVGQLYLVTVVASVVSRMARARDPQPDETSVS
jgi:drug/metabolite transporter (DMT)-like permease